MSENPKPFDDTEEVSAVLPVTGTNNPPVLDVELDRAHDALPANIAIMPVEALIDEMLRRLNEHDYLATLMLAELVVLQTPGHGLAMVCRKEALTALEPMLQAPLARLWPDDTRTASLGEEARTLLTRVDETTKVAALLATSRDLIVGLRALHELLRVGAVRAARATTVLERSNTMPAPPSDK